MGHCGYYCCFICRYSVIAKLLYGLITTFEWTKECEKSFQTLKQELITAPILRAPDYTKVFHVHVDASAYAVGCVLAQLGDGNMVFKLATQIDSFIQLKGIILLLKGKG